MVTVASIDRMDDDLFMKHMRRRHPESMAGLFDEFASDYVAECYRAFHRQLHVWRADLEHDHSPS